MPVNTEHRDYIRMKAKWQRCRDVAAGMDAVHEAGSLYLPMLKDQTSAAYAAYVQRADFYNATWRTVTGLLGLLFRKPPVIEVPDAVAKLLEDVDGAGQPFQLLLQAISENALIVGREGILVDHPTAPEGATRADALLLNLRPTIQLYRAETIISWKLGRVNNKTVLVRAVLKEEEEVAAADDEFKTKAEPRWRVLDLLDHWEPVPAGAPPDNTPPSKRYRQRVFKQKATATVNKAAQTSADFEQMGEAIYPTMNNRHMTFIPFIILGVDTMTVEVDTPPLIDLVDVNLSHYRTGADYAHGCHFSGLPTLFLAGLKMENPDEQIYIGSEKAIVTSNENAKASFIEVNGDFPALKEKLDRAEKQMAILGARMLEPQIKGVEAADTAAIHRKGEESTLSSIAQAISFASTQALKWFTEWAGADPANVKVELNRNFSAVPMTPTMLAALLSGWQQGAPGFSDQSLFDLLKIGEIVKEDATLEEEQARIAERQQEIADLNAASMAAQQGQQDQQGGA